MMLGKPERTEYPADTATYIERYSEADDIVDCLRKQAEQVASLLKPLSAAQWGSRYLAGKWSVKEVIGHLMDHERIASYRMLRIARGDTTPLPGYDENAYAAHACYHELSPETILQDYSMTRAATLASMRSVPAAAWPLAGTANGASITARAVAYLLAGHEQHHIQVLRERYHL